MPYDINEIAVSDLGVSFRCDCGKRYLWFRHETGCRDWYKPEALPTYTHCALCQTNLGDVRGRRRI